MNLIPAFLNSLWQAMLLAALVWVVLRFSPRMNAATRFAIWWAALAVVVILPVAPRILAPALSTSNAPRPVTKQVRTSPPTPVQGSSLPAIVIVEGRNATRWRWWIAAAWGLMFL